MSTVQFDEQVRITHIAVAIDLYFALYKASLSLPQSRLESLEVSEIDINYELSIIWLISWEC